MLNRVRLTKRNNTLACFAVASTQADDALSYWSNYGQTAVHLAAPGQNILSTVSDSDAAYAWDSGTSMAAPVVSGAGALLKAAAPWATAQQIKCALPPLVPGGC